MIDLRIPPKNLEELYEFFMYIARPPVKSHIVYLDSPHYIREDWVVNFYQKREKYSFWFRYKESDPPIWYRMYEKYLYENEATCKHR